MDYRAKAEELRTKYDADRAEFAVAWSDPITSPNERVRYLSVTLYSHKWAVPKIICACVETEREFLDRMISENAFGSASQSFYIEARRKLESKLATFKCASKHCPGYPYRASDMAHPNTCR